MGHDEYPTPVQRFQAEYNLCPLQRLAGDASARLYYRITEAGDRKKFRYIPPEIPSVIVCYDPEYNEDSADLYRFLRIHAWLTVHHIRVPRIYVAFPQFHILIEEDLGDVTMQQSISELRQTQIDKLLRDAIGLMHRWQIRSLDFVRKTGVNESMNLSRMLFEMDFFIEHFLVGLLETDPEARWLADWRQSVVRLCENLEHRQLFVPTHRDYHSRNLLLAADGLAVIDFQDMRWGLPQYDLCSLLYDSYCLYDPDMTEHLIREYYDHCFPVRQGSKPAQSFESFDELVSATAVQRNLKALGTFGFQIHRKGRYRYEDAIYKTLHHLDRHRQRNRRLATVIDPILSESARYHPKSAVAP